MKQSPVVLDKLKFNNKWTILPINSKLLKMSKTIVILKLGQEATRQFSLFVQIYPVNTLYHKSPLFSPAVRISIRTAGDFK